MGWKSCSTPYVLPRESGQSDVWTASAPGRASQRIIDVGPTSPTAEVREALRLGPVERVIARRRVALLDGEPVELVTSCYPERVAAGTPLALPRRIRGGAPTVLAELGYRPKKVIEDIEQRAATQEEAEQLGIASDDAVLTLLRTSVPESGEPYEVSLMVMKRPRHLRYVLEM